MLLTRSPLRHTSGLPLRYASLDLHALGTPPAFILSQDQTLQRKIRSSHPKMVAIEEMTLRQIMKCLQFGSQVVKT